MSWCRATGAEQYGRNKESANESPPPPPPTDLSSWFRESARALPSVRLDDVRFLQSFADDDFELFFLSHSPFYFLLCCCCYCSRLILTNRYNGPSTSQVIRRRHTHKGGGGGGKKERKKSAPTLTPLMDRLLILLPVHPHILILLSFLCV